VILEFIERLRERPARERKQWAFGIALGITLLVGFVWASVLMVRISNMLGATPPPTENSTLVATDTPFGTLMGGFRDAWGSFKESLSNANSIDYVPTSTESAENGLR